MNAPMSKGENAADEAIQLEAAKIREQLLAGLEMRLSKNARIMFASLVNLVMEESLSVEEAKRTVAKICEYEITPTQETEAEIFAQLSTTIVRRGELSEFENEVLADLESLQNRGLLRTDAAEHLRSGLMRLRKPLTPDMVRELLAAFVKRKDCVVHSSDVKAVINKYQ